MAMRNKIFLYIYALLTAIITSASFGAHEYGIGFFALGLGMAAIFIFYNYNHPTVREWVNMWF
jgi:hypothetical protein